MPLTLAYLTTAADRVEVRGPENKLLVVVRVSEETGKYVVDDHATGALHKPEELTHSTFGE